jgi:hypothetical protein
LRQCTYTPELSVIYKNAYDEFFSGLGIELNEAGFFVSPIPYQEKPLESIKPGHKLRTKEKRAFKRQIAEEVCRCIRRDVAAGWEEPMSKRLPAQIADALES